MEKFNPSDSQLAKEMSNDPEMRALTSKWFIESCRYRYSYNFTWLGRPVIQFPQDMMAIQEIVWNVKPDLIIETGVAHGGSLIYSASLLELLGGTGQVIGIDIDIRSHNRAAIEAHPLSKRITLVEGSSVEKAVVEQVETVAASSTSTLVILDSNHTHEHVAKELALYSPLVTKDSYLIVFDTVIDDMPDELFPDRPWGKGNNPKTAVHEFLAQNDRFVIDEAIEQKLLITVAPNGYLKCVK